MTNQNIADILMKISAGLDPDEIVDRLGVDSSVLCEALAHLIEDRLEEFEDVFEEEK